MRHIGSPVRARRDAAVAEAKFGQWVLFGLITVILTHTMQRKMDLLAPRVSLGIDGLGSMIGPSSHSLGGTQKQMRRGGTTHKGTRRDIGRDAGSSIMG